MSIVTFPLDVTDYSADALGAWFAGRTRGVFAADGHYHITTNDNMSVTVGAGLAWLKMTEHWGVVAFNREPVTLEVQAAGNTLQRVDAVCLQLDKVANRSRLFVKTGEPGVNRPVAPVRDSSVDEIYLATITVPAGAASIQASHITDQRLDEHFCGIMSDGTKIPTQQLYDTWMAWFADLKGTLDDDALGNLFNRIMVLERMAGELEGRATALEATSQVFNRVWIYDTVGTHTWVRPPGVSRVEVTMIGGGQGGMNGTSGSNTSGGQGGRGGASGMYRHAIVPVTTNTVSVTVGAGGANAPFTSGNAGLGVGTGGTSMFGTLLSAPGGSNVVNAWRAGNIISFGGPGGPGNAAAPTTAFFAHGGGSGGEAPNPNLIGGGVGANESPFFRAGGQGGSSGVGGISGSQSVGGGGGGGGGGIFSTNRIAGNGSIATASPNGVLLELRGRGGYGGIGFGGGGGGGGGGNQGNPLASGGGLGAGGHGAGGLVIVRAIG